MGGEDDGRAALGLGVHRLPKVAAGVDVHAGGRLVEDDELGVGEQGQGESHPLLLAARALADLAFGDFREIRALQDFADRAARRQHAGDHGDDFVNRVLAKEAAALQKGRQPAVVYGLARIPAENGDRPGVGPREVEDHVERRGLARAVGAKKRDDLAAVDGERHAVDRVDLAERLVNVLDDEGGFDAGSVIARRSSRGR